MERFESITIILLLAVVLLALAAPPFCLANRSSGAKTARVLLQEGLYAEEIEGDLDAAIKIYRQVIAESKQMKQTAAQATYRIAICYLKKGEKAEAARELRNLVSKFPQQELLIKEAQKQLANVEPLAGFGPVIKRLVNDDGVGEDFLLDLDTGRLYSASDAKKWGETSGAAQEKSLEDFIMESGVDLFGETSKKSLMGIDMTAIPTHNERWNMSPEDVIEQVSLGKPGTPVALSADGELPKTFVFKTGQGGMGILQITEMQDGKAARHFRIRYKMLQEAEKTAPTEVLGPVIERVIYSEATGEPFFFDLDTGQAFYPPPGLTRYSPGREVIEWSATKGIDFVNDRGRIELAEMTAVKVVSSLWESATRAEIRDTLMKGSTQKIIPTHSKDYTISSPITYAFKTRENGLGLLQILEKKDENLRIRYKMLQKVPAAVKDKHQELQERAESAKKLEQLGLAVAMYADDHESKLPDSLQELEPYVGKKQDFQWILENVEYLGNGKTVVGSFNFVTAYDKTLLEEGNGTNVLFGDSHVKFEVPKRIEELGITPKTAGATFDGKHR